MRQRKVKQTRHPATRNRTRDHLIAAVVYSQMLYQLSYSRRWTQRLSALVETSRAALEEDHGVEITLRNHDAKWRTSEQHSDES